MINAINYATRQVKSSFDVQGEASIRLIYKTCGWTLGAGYNIYGRSKETLKIDKKATYKVDTIKYGIKGTAGNYGMCMNSAGELQATGAYKALNSTQTFTGATAFYVPDTSNVVDNDTDYMTSCDQTFQFDTWDGADAVKFSNPAELVAPDQLKTNPLPKTIMHKIFAHADYQWKDECWDYVPYVGIYGEYGFSGNDIGKSLIVPASWSIGIRGGIAF